MVRTKICGITAAEDAQHAAACGADAVGAVFSPGYAPSVSVAEGCAVFSGLPPFITLVALFVSPEADLVRQVVGEAKPHILQFHGEEPEEFCSGFGVPYLKACKVTGVADIMALMDGYRSASAYLLDGHSESAPGGTGSSFDWTLAREARADKPLVVAGGLTPGNVAMAIEACRPYGVDVSSGVALVGDRRRKDHGKVREFIKNARSANV